MGQESHELVLLGSRFHPWSQFVPHFIRRRGWRRHWGRTARWGGGVGWRRSRSGIVPVHGEDVVGLVGGLVVVVVTGRWWGHVVRDDEDLLTIYLSIRPVTADHVVLLLFLLLVLLFLLLFDFGSWEMFKLAN